MVEELTTTVLKMSTCTGPEPLDIPRRWDKKKKDFVKYPDQTSSRIIEVNSTRKRGRPMPVLKLPNRQNESVSHPTWTPEKTKLPTGQSREKKGAAVPCVNLKTDTYCEKFEVPLCFREKQNCYREYHAA